MKPRTLLHLGIFLLMLTPALAKAQSVSPVITEYKQKGEGKILLVNDTLTPLVVILQPQSFSIEPDGTAKYHALDPAIHVDLSTTSVRLQPKQEYYVFYKAHADSLPAWFTIYATFSAAQRGPGINLRIMLPHTVYLYQKESLTRQDVRTGDPIYDRLQKVITCDIENVSKAYGRMREGSVEADKESIPVGGFPLLPGNPRRLEIPWTGKNNPDAVVLHFDRFDIKLPVLLPPIAESK